LVLIQKREPLFKVDEVDISSQSAPDGTLNDLGQIAVGCQIFLENISHLQVIHGDTGSDRPSLKDSTVQENPQRLNS
jgi:hypothetical protein